MRVSLSPSGEGALRLTVADADAETAWQTVHRVADWMTDRPLPGVHGAVATYESMLVEFDPMVQSFEALEPLLQLMARDALRDAPVDAHPRRRFELPVVYGGEHGPDLAFVADFLGISEAEVVALHTAEERVVRCLGGPAASCMIDGPDFAKPIPRLADPRLEVPPNAISVAGVQGVLGPVRAPSGWRLIGLSPVSVMDITSPRLVPYRPGDSIRFRAIAAEQWGDYEGTFLADHVIDDDDAGDRAVSDAGSAAAPVALRSDLGMAS
ncbi:5-oxoprolinase subunit PxpB [Schumannella luteola]|uniref:KipI family sensor histidine kinase inhibitor n=1 Tax=Schumannella luteola TaxID=472059 RepID=A0A852YIR2_9MICO|nr:carboxyltransferase domain-containing protein [Schumannella luteola]NYG97669.1 KipI family sensor histidine kinase inhibitor [Schumannella luteola]TPX01456.1 allophanate hydrolase subunit 1 [Schumannella luteola]